MRFSELVDRIHYWQSTTFADTGIAGSISHLKKEVEELEKTPDDPLEAVDIIIIALDILRKQGYYNDDVESLLRYKFTVNEHRKWPPKGEQQVGKAVEHVR